MARSGASARPIAWLPRWLWLGYAPGYAPAGVCGLRPFPAASAHEGALVPRLWDELQVIPAVNRRV